MDRTEQLQVALQEADANAQRLALELIRSRRDQLVRVTGFETKRECQDRLLKMLKAGNLVVSDDIGEAVYTLLGAAFQSGWESAVKAQRLNYMAEGVQRTTQRS